MYRIDLNSDIGELEGDKARERDREIMRYVTSVNLACGYHAGSSEIMEQTLRTAAELGTALGVHPGFPDRRNFGRTNMDMSPEEVKKIVKDQIEILGSMADKEGVKLQHVKPHGALYNISAKDPEIADAIAEAICETDRNLFYMGLSGSEHIRAAGEAGLRSVSEVFGDRAYMDDGSLVPRSMPGAVIHDPNEVIDRVVKMVKEGTVRSISGKEITVKADSVCVHGDTTEALEFVSKIREALEKERVKVICPWSEE